MLPRHSPTGNIHAEDAEARDIAHGETAKVFNDRGEFTGPAQISDDVMPGIVLANLDHWHVGSGGSSVNAITLDEHCGLGNAGVYSDNLVEVMKIDQASWAPLDELRQQLSDARKAAATQVASLSRQFDEIVVAATDVATDDEHDPEGNTIAWERQQIAALLAKAKSDLVAVEAAISRLGDGSHGSCLRCGTSIAPARLEALPGVETCVDCAW